MFTVTRRVFITGVPVFNVTRHMLINSCSPLHSEIFHLTQHCKDFDV